MNQRVSSIRNIRTIKALRGEILRVDLGKEFSGGVLTAWMKKNPNDITYRSFDIEDNRYLILTKDKSKDFYNIDNELVEAIAGKWYFDVEFLKDGDDESLSKTIYTGTIFFVNDITGSPGFEITGDGAEFPEYTLSTIVDSKFSLLKNGTPVANEIDLTPYENTGADTYTVSGSLNSSTGIVTFIRNDTTEFTVDLSALINETLPTKTSDLINDGIDSTSTFVENDEIGAVATSNDYNDLNNKPNLADLPYIAVNASRNLLDSDSGKVLIIQNSGVILTVLTTLSASFNCCITPQTGYDATMVAGAGVTFDAPNGLAIAENETISIGRLGNQFIIRP